MYIVEKYMMKKMRRLSYAKASRPAQQQVFGMQMGLMSAILILATKFGESAPEFLLMYGRRHDEKDERE